MRQEFSTRVRREALQRSGGKCEATGPRYGLPAGERCGASLGYGVEFDHELPDWMGGEPTLENCVAACRQCHRYATDKTDAPARAKAKRVRDRHAGTKAPSRNPMPGGRGSKFKIKIGGRVEER